MAIYREIKDAKATDKKAAYQARIENAGFEAEADLDAAIKKIEESRKRSIKRDLGEDAPPEVSLSLSIHRPAQSVTVDRRTWISHRSRS